MKIYLTRHGQTELNKKELMQGMTDEPLNDTGRTQAKAARKFIENVKFDKVISSPLVRARETAAILADIPIEDVTVDERIIEVNFGDYELRSYHNLGPALSLYWLLPEVFPAPKSVENVKSMVARSHGFLKELENKDYENVLVVCHGGIIRPMCGYLMDKRSGLKWRPRPTNCEIRVFESINGKHRLLESFKEEQ